MCVCVNALDWKYLNVYNGLNECVRVNALE